LEGKRRAPVARDLIELAKQLSAPENAVRAAAALSPDYHIVASGEGEENGVGISLFYMS